MILAGQIVLVTGASRGIGKAIALRLASEGALVIGTATTDAGAKGISDMLVTATGVARGHGMRLEVRDAAACEALIDTIQKQHGAVTILVNNAGITRDNLALRMKDEEWSSVIAINLDAVFRLSKLVLRAMMKARYGRIINVGSVVGSSGNAGQANYAAAKAGVAGMSRALARELGSRQITVNCVAPGFIETAMTHGLSQEQSAMLLEQIPLARLGQPEEIAAAVNFLASKEAGYITGVTLHVNGGMYME